MRIFGLNVASNSTSPNGRGGIRPETGEFDYLPIREAARLDQPAPTYRSLGFEGVKHPDLRVHLDPEFETFTYGHVRRFGDACLFKMQPGDILFFYATLDLLPTRKQWGAYIIGHFEIDHIQDARILTIAGIKSLRGFQHNAHLKRADPAVDLLVKGTEPGSRLYRRALRLSHPDDNRRLHPSFGKLLTTVTGKAVAGAAWHRWLLYSDQERLAEVLRDDR